MKKRTHLGNGRTLVLLLVVLLIAGLLPLAVSAAVTIDEAIVYYDSITNTTLTQTDYTLVEAQDTEWIAGWYVAQGNIVLSGRVNIQGDVHLILADGALLEAPEGIRIVGENSFTVYGQSEGDRIGVLSATSYDKWYPAIGADPDMADIVSTSLTINGGHIKIASTANYGIKTNEFTVNGGKLTGSLQAQFGGIEADTMTVNGGIIDVSDVYCPICPTYLFMNGGSLTAVSENSAPLWTPHITISGGEINVKSNNHENAINVTELLISGGKLTAESAGHSIKVTKSGQISGGTVITSGIDFNNQTFEISGGQVTVGEKGINAADYNGNPIIISGGVVDVRSESAFYLSTGANGSAVITTKVMPKIKSLDKWSAMILHSSGVYLYGESFVLDEDIVFPAKDDVYVTDGAGITISEGITVTANTIYVDPGATLTNNGTLIIENSLAVSEYGTFVNNGTLIIKNELNVNKSATLINNGTLENQGKFTNFGTVQNDGEIQNSGTYYPDIENASNGDAGVATGDGTVTGNEPQTGITIVDGLYIRGGKLDVDFKVDASTITILTGKPISIESSITSSIARRIAFESAEPINLTLEGCNINGLILTEGDEVNLTLVGENLFAGRDSSFPIALPAGASLTIDGEGSLAIDSKTSAISSSTGAFGDLTVNGGTVQITVEGTSSVGIGVYNIPSYDPQGSLTANGGKLTVEKLGTQYPYETNGPAISVGTLEVGGTADITATSSIGIAVYAYRANFTGGALSTNGSIEGLNVYSNINISGGTLDLASNTGAGLYNATGYTLTISGGTVNAYSESNNEHGGAIIASNAVFSGGKITANAPNASDLYVGSYSTGQNGTAYITLTDARTDSESLDLTTYDGIFHDLSQDTYYIIGDQTLTEDLTIGETEYLIINKNSTLTVAEGVTLTNNLAINNEGTLVNRGTIVLEMWSALYNNHSSSVVKNFGTINGGIYDHNDSYILNGNRTSVGKIYNVGTIDREIRPNTDHLFDFMLYGDFAVTGGTYGEDFSYENGVLTIFGGAGSSLSVTTPNHTAENPSSERIVVTKYSPELQLNGVHLASNTPAYAPLEVNDASLRLKLLGENTLKNTSTAEGHGALYAPDCDVNLYANASSDDVLTITSAGGDAVTAKTFTLSEGTLNITASGKGAKALHVTSFISQGGTVNAVAEAGASGICVDGKLNITGGKLISKVIGADAIAVYGEIHITNGELQVEASGAGAHGVWGTVTADGGKITATATGENAVGIGVLTANGGKVVATAEGENAVGISALFTRESEKTFIVASSVGNISIADSWYGIVLIGDKGYVSNKALLTEDFTVPAGVTLTLAQGSALTVESPAKLYVEGALYIELGAALNVAPVLNGGKLYVETEIYFDLSNLIGGDPNIIVGTQNYTTFLDPETNGYDLPESIEVTIDDEALTANTDYTYDNITGELTIYAPKLTDRINVANKITVKAAGVPKTYSIRLNTNGGTIAEGKNVTSYTYGDSVHLPQNNDITREGCLFLGWYFDPSFEGGSITDIASGYMGDLEFYAKWKIETYTVTYMADGKPVGTPQTVYPGENATAPEIPAKVGYTQTAPYWDKSSENITSDLEINAVYTINKYTVTYKVDDETYGTPQIIEHGGNTIPETAPEKSGYTVAWSHNGQNITSDLTIEALYTSIVPARPKTYVVTYMADGKIIIAQQVEHGDNTTPPAIPRKEGYDKTAPYWKHDGKNITASMTIEAVYVINIYTVTYMADGAVIGTELVEHGKDATLPAIPAKEGYTETAPHWDHDGVGIQADMTISVVYTADETTTTETTTETTTSATETESSTTETTASETETSATETSTTEATASVESSATETTKTDETEKKGNAALWIVLVVVALLAVGGAVGYVIYTKRKT